MLPITKIVAVCLTFGRARVCELIAQWERQTLPCPLLLWIDNAPQLVTSGLPPWVMPIYGPPLGTDRSIGAVRRAAVEAAISRYQLTLLDALIILDDDDYYSPDHASECFQSLRQGPFVTSRRFGLMRHPHEIPPYLFAPNNFPDPGMGTHGTWAFTVGKYFDAGGYRDADIEDVDLFVRLGGAVQRSRVTHVRRQYGVHLSRTAIYDREHMRAQSDVVTHLRPVHTPELDQLAAWCRAQG